MHTQVRTTSSVDISVPEHLNNGSFEFKKYFALGGEGSTNVSKRLGTFDNAFYDVANHRCKMPRAICFKDIPEKIVDTILGVLPQVQISKKLWEYRIPIKLVGYLKDQQKTGAPGLLLVDGGKNVFVSRDNWNELEIVELAFVSGSWVIYSQGYSPNYVLEGPCRFFYGCRH